MLRCSANSDTVLVVLHVTRQYKFCAYHIATCNITRLFSSISKLLITLSKKRNFRYHQLLIAYRCIHSFIHWHAQNETIPCRSQQLLPFLSVVYSFPPPSSTNWSSIFPYFVLPSISRSTSQPCFCRFILKLSGEFCFLPFSVHAQTNTIYLSILPLLQ